jgi:hypothetical protein
MRSSEKSGTNTHTQISSILNIGWEMGMWYSTRLSEREIDCQNSCKRSSVFQVNKLPFLSEINYPYLYRTSLKTQAQRRHCPSAIYTTSLNMFDYDADRWLAGWTCVHKREREREREECVCPVCPHVVNSSI